MKKVTITTQNGEMKFQMPEEKVSQLITQAFAYSGCTESSPKDVEKEEVSGEEKENFEIVENNENEMQADKVKKPVRLFTGPTEFPEGYKGFILAECEECGRYRGFCAKQPTKFVQCVCGHETPLSNMKPAFVHCSCGRTYKYRTNFKSKTIPYHCIDCGRKVQLAINKKGTAYVTAEVE